MAQLKALGGLELSPGAFTQPKPLLLLAYLALEGAQQRRHLAELFWPGGHSLKSLSMTLTRLKQGAGPVVAADERRAWANAPSDAGALLAALERGEWAQAAALYRGAFLEGVVLDDWSSELEEWVYGTREHLAARVQHGLLNLAEAAAKARDFRGAAALAERAYTLPGVGGSEVSALRRLYALLAAGQSVHAPEVRKELEGYQLAVTLSTEAARATFEAADAAPHNLVPRPTSFVGRARELAALERLIADPDARLVTLTGAGGVGKTRLALQAAETCLRRGDFPGGVYWVALEALQGADEVAPHVAQALGLARTDDPLTHLVSAIGERRLLLALDNFEHLLDACPLLEALLSACPALKLLVTSRERLGLPGEWLLPVEGLSFPQGGWEAGDRGESWADCDAVRLFVARARQLRPDLDAAAELPHIVALCRRLDGLPLALELAAGWVRLMSCAEIARELDADLDFLSSSLRGLPERHRSLRDMFEASWRRLSAKEQGVLSRLAVFRGGFRREAAAEVAGATLGTLAHLADMSLLRVLPGGRYDRHPLLHQYIGEKLAADPDTLQEARALHQRYVLALLRRQGRLHAQGQQRAVVETLNEEWDNIRLALEAALADPDTLEQLTGLMYISFELRGALREGLAFLERAVRALAAEDPASPEAAVRLGAAILERAWFLYRLGRYPEAERSAREGLAQLPPEASARRARGYVTLGALAQQAGDYPRALRILEEALELTRAGSAPAGEQGGGQQDEQYEAVVLGNLAGVHQHLGDFAAAAARYQEALARYRRLGAVTHLVRESNNLANLHFAQGDLGRAEALWRGALRQARALGFTQTLPHLLTNLSNALEARGDLAGATALNLEALELVRETGQHEIRITILNNLVSALGAQGDFAGALPYAHEALELGRSLAAMPKLMQALLARGELALRMADGALAARLLGFVAAHPATVSYERDAARALLAQLGTPLPPFVSLEEALAALLSATP